MRGAGKGLRRIAPVRDHRVGGLGGAHALEQVGIARQRRALLPRHLERARGLDRVPLALGDDADEVALAHDRAPGMAAIELSSMLKRLGAVAIGALPARPHDAAVQHVGHAHLLHVDVSSGHLVRDIDARHARAHELVPVDRLLRRDAGELDVERLVAEQLAVADGAAGMTVDRHHALSTRRGCRSARRAASRPAPAAPAAPPRPPRGPAGRRDGSTSSRWSHPGWARCWCRAEPIVSWLMSRSSSSPAICSRPVVLPWPNSPLPR